MSGLTKNTGERVVEEHYVRSRESYLIYLMHIATYNYARSYIKGKHVLDLGCGTGYGTALIADECASICGVDISDEAIVYASAKYQAPNLTFKTIHKVEDRPLPFEDKRFDVILPFQVIEHISNASAYLEEVYRVLKPGGIFIVATPDRSTRLLPLQRPWNRYHVVEYSGAGFVSLLATRFPDVQLLHMSGAKAIINLELKRTRRLMWLTLPVTFPFSPEWLRVRGLDFLKRLKGRQSQKNSGAAISHGFDESCTFIAKEASPSVNLIALVRK